MSLKLKGTDIFAISKIVKKLGLNIKTLVTEYSEIQAENVKLAKGEKYAELDDETKIAINNNGLKLVDTLINEVFIKLDNAEDDIIKLMAKVSNKKVEEIQDLEMDEFADIIKGIVTHEGFSKLLTTFKK